MASVVWLRGRHREHHHLRDEDDDSSPHREHDLQYACSSSTDFSEGIYPTLVLNLVLLPLNTLRLHQMRKLIQDVEAAASMGETSIDWLKPFMSRRSFRKGDIVFRKGDTADAMYYSVTGRYRLKEMGIEIPVGHVFGDLGFLAPDNRRTQTIECTEDGEVLTATYQQVKELYFQNPQFGFFFMRLTSERLFDNIKRLEQEIVRKNEVIAELGRESRLNVKPCKKNEPPSANGY